MPNLVESLQVLLEKPKVFVSLYNFHVLPQDTSIPNTVEINAIIHEKKQKGPWA